MPRLTSVGVLAESSRVRSCCLSCTDEIIGRHRIATRRCQSERRVVGIPPGFRSGLVQLERFRFEHRDLAVAARTLRPDVAVVATLADSGRAVLVPPRGSLLADATLPLLALAHLGESLSRTPSPARPATMDGWAITHGFSPIRQSVTRGCSSSAWDGPGCLARVPGWRSFFACS